MNKIYKKLAYFYPLSKTNGYEYCNSSSGTRKIVTLAEANKIIAKLETKGTYRIRIFENHN